jgi:hypothetical protein
MVVPAIDAVHPSCEIETRGDFVNQIGLALADNAQQRSVLLGAPVLIAARGAAAT